jgi:hypothetical protein
MERSSVVGGHATTLSVDSSKYGMDWVNTGVHFGPPNFSTAFQLFREYGYEAYTMKHQMTFGRGTENFWTTVFPTPLIQKHEEDIKRFRKLLKLTKVSRKLFWSMPLKTFLRIFRFDKEFGEKILYPLASTLVPMGNYGDRIPVGLAWSAFAVERRNIFDPATSSAMPNLPTMYAFPNFGRFFQGWAKTLRSRGVQIRLNTQALQVVQRNKQGIAVDTRSAEVDCRIDAEGVRDRTITENFDKLIICVNGDEAKRMLGSRASPLEKLVLGWVRFFDDISVTHTDSSYIRGKYEAIFRDELCPEPNSEAEKERIKFARGDAGPRSGYKPSYLTYSYPQIPNKVELTFDCSNIRGVYPHEPERNEETEVPFDRHIFQTHFMDKDVKHLWTIDQIQRESILERKWLHIPFQTWQHWLRVVPLLKYINGTKGTFYAGGWTLVVSCRREQGNVLFGAFG